MVNNWLITLMLRFCWGFMVKNRLITVKLNVHRALERPKKRGAIHVSHTRAEKTDVGTHKAILEADKWATNVQAHEVTCAGCRKSIKLRKEVMYALKPWENHKGGCKMVQGNVSSQIKMPIRRLTLV